MNTDQRILIIGIGNLYRSDDGIGRLVARRLRRYRIRGLDVVDESGDGTSLIELWRDRRFVICVDAARSGKNVGTVHRFEVHDEQLPSRILHHSTHALGLVEAIELSRVLGQLPERFIVYGIECGDFNHGELLSVEVGEAVKAVVHAVLEDVRRYREHKDSKVDKYLFANQS